MIAAGSLFTSCVTNTEPQGIKDIREAKADYIESLVKLKTAEAAKEQAKADYIQAKVAFEQIQNQIEQCKADSAATRLKVILKEQELALAEAEADLKAALDSIALASVKLTPAEGRAIEAYVTAYNEYVKAEKDVREAQQALWDETYTESAKGKPVEEYRADLLASIAEKEATIATNEAAIAGWETIKEEELLNYGVWKDELDKYKDSLNQFKYRENQIEKDKAYYRVEHKDDFIAFFAGINEMHKAYEKALNPTVPFKLDKEYTLPVQATTNGVVSKFANYVNNGINKTEITVDAKLEKLKAKFEGTGAQGKAEEAIFGDEDHPEKYSLTGIIDALKRDSVVVNSFIKDTAGLAKAVAAAEKAYTDTLAVLKKGVDAYPAVKKAKKDAADAADALVSAKTTFATDTAALVAAANKVIAEIKEYATYAAEEKLRTRDTTELLNAIRDFSVKKYALFEMPDSKKDSIKYISRIGATKDKDVYSTIFFDSENLKKKGFMRNVAQGKRWPTNYRNIGSWLNPEYERIYDPVASYMLTETFVDALHEDEDVPYGETGLFNENKKAIDNANPLLALVDTALGVNKTSFSQFAEFTIADIVNWGVAKKDKKSDKYQDILYKEGKGFTYKSGGYYKTSALENAETADTKAKEAVTSDDAKVGVYAKFYKNVYGKFWGVNYEEIKGNIDFKTGRLTKDSLSVNYSDDTFAGLINFSYAEGKTPWGNKTIHYENVVIDDENAELQIVLENVGFKQLFNGSALAEINDDPEHNWTLYLKSVIAKAVLEDAQNYEDNKEALAELEQVVEDVIDDYYAACEVGEDQEAAQDSAVIAILGEDIVKAEVAKLVAAGNKNARPYNLYNTAEIKARLFVDKDITDPQAQINEVYRFCSKGKFTFGGAQLTIANATIAKYPEVQYGWDKEKSFIDEASGNMTKLVDALNTFVNKLANLDGYKNVKPEDGVDSVYTRVETYYNDLIDECTSAITSAQSSIKGYQTTLARLDAGYDPKQLEIERLQGELDKAVEALEVAETKLKIAEDAYNQVIKNHE